MATGPETPPVSGESSTDEVSHEHQIPERKHQIRLVLLGKTGSGKSASGNTFLGKKVFKSSVGSDSQTKQCQSETTVRMGKQISVIDTPGLYDNELSEEEVITEIVKCITYASPGPHAFLIVIRVGRFTEEEKNTIEQLKKVFGKEMEKYTFVLFTHKDQLEKRKKTIEQFLQDGDQDLRELVESCGNRFLCLDNESASYPQFRDLISEIEKMVEENGGTHFTNDTFDEMEKNIQKIQKQKLDEKVKQFKQEHEEVTVTKTEWQKIYWRFVEESREEAEQCFTKTFLRAFLEASEACKAMIDGMIVETSREVIRLAFRATRKLARQKICAIQ